MEVANYNSQTRRSVAPWFASPAGLNPADDLVRQAFESAKAHISDELPEKERNAIFENQAASMQDFTSVLSTARSRYESRKDSKAYTWLEKLSSRVVYYGNLLDVLVQHHPEYVSLAWGTFKFLFVSVLNHEEMIKSLAKSCTNIAETLPRANLSLILYPTAAMREAVARLYAVIMKFITHSVRWYRRSRLKHMLASITSPWSLDYEPELREIELHARNVDKLAQSGSQAELREAHLEIQQIRDELQATRGEIRVLATFVEDKFQRLIEFASVNQTLQLRISADVTSSKQMISHVQLGQILSLSFMESLPTSGQCLAHCRSLRIRRRGGLPTDTGPSASAIRKLNQQQGLNFLVVEDGSPINVKDFLFDMIGVLRHLGLPVLWILRPRDLQRSSLTSLDVIRMLFYQALEINGVALNTSHPITVAQLREASTHDDWLLLLKRALLGLSGVYIIMDSDVMEYITNGDKEIATRFLTEFVRILGPETVRFMVSSHIFQAQQAKTDLGDEAVAAVRAQRHVRHGNQAVAKRKVRLSKGRHNC